MKSSQLRAIRRKYYLKNKLNKEIEQITIENEERDKLESARLIDCKRLEKENGRKLNEEIKYLEHSKNKILYTYDEFNEVQLNHIAKHKMIKVTAVDSFKKEKMKLAVKASTLDEAIKMINEINTMYLEKQEYIVDIKEIKGENKDENNI